MDANKFAFVTIVHTNAAYFCGAIALCHSLRRHGTTADVVVLVTPDVASEGRAALEGLGARVVEVEYITAASRMPWPRFREMYSSWLDRCFTKYHVLRLTEYDKVLFLDADMLALSNVDELFALPAPAGICSAVPEESAQQQERWHGRTLPPSLVQRSLDEGYGMRGCAVLLEPRQEDFDALVRRLQTHGVEDNDGRHVGPDERVITTFFSSDGVSEKRSWTHVHARFGCNSWKTDKGYAARMVHFVSEKPWSYKKYWDDFKVWEDAALAAFVACRGTFTILRQHSRVFESAVAQALLAQTEEPASSADVQAIVAVSFGRGTRVGRGRGVNDESSVVGRGRGGRGRGIVGTGRGRALGAGKSSDKPASSST